MTNLGKEASTIPAAARAAASPRISSGTIQDLTTNRRAAPIWDVSHAARLSEVTSHDAGTARAERTMRSGAQIGKSFRSHAESNSSDLSATMAQGDRMSS